MPRSLVSSPGVLLRTSGFVWVPRAGITVSSSITKSLPSLEMGHRRLLSSVPPQLHLDAFHGLYPSMLIWDDPCGKCQQLKDNPSLLGIFLFLKAGWACVTILPIFQRRTIALDTCHRRTSRTMEVSAAEILNIAS